MIPPITTVLIAASAVAPAGPYDLTDLATAKDELKIPASDTTADAFLSRGITQVSAAFARECDRVFPVETVQDLFHLEELGAGGGAFGNYGATGLFWSGINGAAWGNGIAPLQLSRWPIAGVTVLTTSADTPAGAVLPFADTTGVAARQQVSGIALPNSTAVQPIAAGTFVQSVAPGSVTLSQPIAADIPAGSAVTFGISVVQQNASGSVFLLAAGNGATGSDFQIDAKRGQLIRLNPATGYARRWSPLITTVVYQAGYSPIPSDLAAAALREVAGRYWDRGRDPMLRSQDQPGLGHQTYWVGSRPGVRGPFPEEIAAVLDLYRQPVLA